MEGALLPVLMAQDDFGDRAVEESTHASLPEGSTDEWDDGVWLVRDEVFKGQLNYLRWKWKEVGWHGLMAEWLAD